MCKIYSFIQTVLWLCLFHLSVLRKGPLCSIEHLLCNCLIRYQAITTALTGLAGFMPSYNRVLDQEGHPYNNK